MSRTLPVAVRARALLVLLTLLSAVGAAALDLTPAPGSADAGSRQIGAVLPTADLARSLAALAGASAGAVSAPGHGPGGTGTALPPGTEPAWHTGSTARDQTPATTPIGTTPPARDSRGPPQTAST